MSYCRWSSNNFQCDLYCYEGMVYTTHVASRRYLTVPEISMDMILLEPDPSKMADMLRKYNDWHSTDLIPIGLPHDGETFHDSSLEEFLERVTMLRDAGYRVPDYVFEAIKEEMADDQSRTLD